MLKAFITQAELETGQKVKALHSDGGGEYMAGHVQQYLQEHGIKHKVTTADTPQHNGIAEHLNCTLLDKVRTMLADANLPKTYWLEVLNYTTLLYNVSSSCSVCTTPSEAYMGIKLSVS
jgi:transposase InsO family protein